MPRSSATTDENVGAALRAANEHLNRGPDIAAGTAAPPFQSHFQRSFVMHGDVPSSAALYNCTSFFWICTNCRIP